MARRSEIMKMPTVLRCELDERLRSNGYGDYDGLAAWLKAEGHPSSKSALHRYGKALSLHDAKNGRQEPCVAVIARRGDCDRVAGRDQLLLELGRLQYRASQIIAELSQLDSGTAK